MIDGYISDLDLIDDCLDDMIFPSFGEANTLNNSHSKTEYLLEFLLDEVQKLLDLMQQKDFDVTAQKSLLTEFLQKIKFFINNSINNNSLSLLELKQTLTEIMNLAKKSQDSSYFNSFLKNIYLLYSSLTGDLHEEVSELKIQRKKIGFFPFIKIKYSDIFNSLKGEGIIFTKGRNAIKPCDFSLIISRIFDILKNCQLEKNLAILTALSQSIKNPINILDFIILIFNSEDICTETSNQLLNAANNFLKVYLLAWNISLTNLFSFDEFILYSLYLTVSKQIGSDMYSILNSINLCQPSRPLIDNKALRDEIFKNLLDEAKKCDKEKRQQISDIVSADINHVLKVYPYVNGWKRLLLEVLKDSNEEYPTVYSNILNKNELSIGGEELSACICSHAKFALSFCVNSLSFMKSSLYRIILHSYSEKCFFILREELTNITNELGNSIFNCNFLAPLFDLCISTPSVFTKPLQEINTNSAFAILPCFENAIDSSALVFALKGSKYSLFLSLVQLHKLFSSLALRTPKFGYLEKLSMNVLDCYECPAFTKAINKLFLSYFSIDMDDKEIHEIGIEIDEISLSIYNRLKGVESIAKPERIIHLVAHIEPKEPMDVCISEFVSPEFSFGKPHIGLWKESSPIPELDDIELDLDSETRQLEVAFGDMAPELQEIVRSLR